MALNQWQGRQKLIKNTDREQPELTCKHFHCLVILVDKFNAFNYKLEKMENIGKPWPFYFP